MLGCPFRASACRAMGTRITPRPGRLSRRRSNHTPPGASRGAPKTEPQVAEKGSADRLLLLGDDRLHLRGDAAADLDLDHERADLADRLREVDPLAVDLQPAGVPDRVRDL